jgi:hypothetical protein
MEKIEKKEETKSRHRSMSMTGVVCQAFVTVFSDSKIHGVSNIVKNQYVIGKLFWFLLALGGSAACVYCKL